MIHYYFQSLILIIFLMTLLWLVSIPLKNVSIVDIFWGVGFIVINSYLFFCVESYDTRQTLLLFLVTIWGLRLSIYLIYRNRGKGEDFRYAAFRKYYGDHRYWWISYFQTFLLQGILMWMVALPLAGVHLSDKVAPFSLWDYLGVIMWIIGMIFEAGGDYQLARFKNNPANRGKVLKTGLWRYTRHPNYFGDAAIWWGYGLICIGAQEYWYVLGSLLMTILIVKVSGVALLEKTLKDQKPEYLDYAQKTSPFFPWIPKKEN